MTRYIDLSQPLHEGVSVYPGDPLFESRAFADHDSDGYRGVRYSFGSHLGTHLDAPRHFFFDGETLDSFPVDFFTGSCACLDVTSLVGASSSRRRLREDTTRPVALTVDDLAPFESLVAAVPILLLRTGWSSRLGSFDYYDDFPSLSPDVCDWLADYPNLRILGLDTPSLVALPGSHASVDDSASHGQVDAVVATPRKPKFDPELREFLVDPLPPSRGCDSSARSEPTVAPPPLDELELMADAECHRILLGRRPPILILEGLVNLEALPQYSSVRIDGRDVGSAPERLFELSCFPLPILGADGSPTRVVARVDLDR